MNTTTNRRRTPGYQPRYLKKGSKKNPARSILETVGMIASAVLTVSMLLSIAKFSCIPVNARSSESNWAVMDRYDTYMTNAVSDALDGVKVIQKVFWLSDEDQIAPEPNPACFGTTDDPSSLQWLLDEAKELLGVETVVFSTETEIMPGSEVTYYLDETILSITWKQICHKAVYTMSEVKIAHPSQFRRFLADGTYGSDKQYMTTEMAETVNAVVASSGDFYKFRSWGVNTYLGEVRNAAAKVDSCFITEEGDLLFAKAGTFSTVDAAQAYVDENNVRFSLAFGPILIEEGQNVVPNSYPLGEIHDSYARAAICQLGECHYLMVAMNNEDDYGYHGCTSTTKFADQLIALGVTHAYALDGGQTAAIVTNGKLINRPTYGYQRLISDIIYFATAIPEENWQETE